MTVRSKIMAIKFQYNKTSLNNLNKQLKMRKNALPTLKNKESALRVEVKKAKDYSEKLMWHTFPKPYCSYFFT